MTVNKSMRLLIGAILLSQCMVFVNPPFKTFPFPFNESRFCQASINTPLESPSIIYSANVIIES